MHSNCPGGSRTVPWEPFGLNVENSGRLLGGGSPGIEASSKLGSRKGLGRAHRFGGCPLLPTAAEPTSRPLVPVLPHLLLTSHHSALGQALPQQDRATTSGNKALGKPGAEPREMSASHSETEGRHFALTLRARAPVCGSLESVLLLPGLWWWWWGDPLSSCLGQLGAKGRTLD